MIRALKGRVLSVFGKQDMGFDQVRLIVTAGYAGWATICKIKQFLSVCSENIVEDFSQNC